MFALLVLFLFRGFVCIFDEREVLYVGYGEGEAVVFYVGRGK